VSAPYIRILQNRKSLRLYAISATIIDDEIGQFIYECSVYCRVAQWWGLVAVLADVSRCILKLTCRCAR